MFFADGTLHRQYMEIDHRLRAVVATANTVLTRGHALFLHLAYRGTQVHRKLLAHQFQQVETRGPGNRVEVGSVLTQKVQYLHVAIDNDAGRTVFTEHQALRLLPKIVGGRVRHAIRVFPGNGLWKQEAGVELVRRPAGIRFLGVNLVLIVHQCEQVGVPTHGFGGTQHQITIGLQCVVKQFQDAFLQHGPKIDQQVAATHQIHFGEGRILDYILHREHAATPHGLVDLITGFDLNEEALQTALLNLVGDTFRIHSGTRHLDGARV